MSSYSLDNNDQVDENAIHDLFAEIRSRSIFVVIFNAMAKTIHENAVEHGWWESERNAGEAIALMHSELSEALEAAREGNPPDEHLPQFDSMTVELADTIIRIMDFAQGMGLPLGEALEAKVAFNRTRPHKHNKEF